MSDIERLKKLRMLLDNDIITNEEYQQRKLEIIAGGESNQCIRLFLWGFFCFVFLLFSLIGPFQDPAMT